LFNGPAPTVFQEGYKERAKPKTSTRSVAQENDFGVYFTDRGLPFLFIFVFLFFVLPLPGIHIADAPLQDFV
jgi:hypothetical protein